MIRTLIYPTPSKKSNNFRNETEKILYYFLNALFWATICETSIS